VYDFSFASNHAEADLESFREVILGDAHELQLVVRAIGL
jgi:hypothetical protein